MFKSITPLTTVGALALTVLAGCPTGGHELPNLDNDASLQRFASCAPMRTYVGDVALETLLNQKYNQWYMWDVAAEDGGTDDSGGDSGPTDYTDTNNQEEGVDELDIVKTDGQHIFVAQDRDLQIVDSWPVEDAELVATVPLDGWARGLFLAGDKVVVFQYVYRDDSTSASEFDFMRNYSGTRATIYDVSDRNNPQLERTIDIEGYLADARMVDGDVYLVMNNWANLPQEAWDLIWGENPVALPEVDWTLEGEALEADIDAKRNEARDILEPLVDDIMDAMALDEVVPRWRDQVEGAPDADATSMLGCTDIYRPQTTSSYNMLSIVNLDLGNGDLNATGVMSDGWTVYASKDNLYVAQTSRWWWWGWGDQDMTTQIHKFQLDAASGEPTYKASGHVDGWLYDQFAMSEHDGYLRVATTDIDWWWGWNTDDTDDGDEPGNNLFVLDDDGSGTLDKVGEVTGMAPGEQIYASRMMGDVGYIVTFRQIDPLFTMDLSDPTDPKVMGELKIPGYSAYLHPMGDDHLLAVGMDGEDDGTITGLAINVFDVSDLADPQLAHQYTIETDGWVSSEALWDHHAFTYHRGVLNIPAYSWDYDDVTGEYDYFSGLMSFDASADGITPLGQINHVDLVDKSECLYEKWYDYEPNVCDDWGWYAQVRRSRYIEDNVFSISNYGMKINDLNDPDTQIGEVLFYPER